METHISGLHVQVQLGLPAVLPRVLEVPLQGEVGVARVGGGGGGLQALGQAEGAEPALHPLEPRLLDRRVHLGDRDRLFEAEVREG
ncbi:hypothetical protein JYU34_018925 [Plutella xylostella]|uniref:Uncharacterized protein n=1 Tax=Plutella xylostella TaxID=51655 RepID=A0ABQ7PYU2_PLUXY|nr:hypothetical protein JYU34_018925 [Plutella xylostella]